ncbi:Sir2 family histone deacetylase Hst2 [Pisolithus orientalis]|uniref:Sir2 family histone deacetylase Hst2 n=1 Tax=Pisolithus orientalis TaxID=936130 RepID=UPI0022245D60|nr:Sir2 family histone deacetylase Hst2 [Pisolithus orientalis]KAI6030419.1 Sir2 family histone deacetylase Hst2 [Pisolithus orientalis]
MPSRTIPFRVHERSNITTGLYANLARLNLPYPEAVFQISFFRNNPVPFYTLAKEIYPERYRPTLTHSFIKLLHSRGLLHTCFTQNIDTLERKAGVPEHKIVEAHGSFATQRCIDCKAPYEDEKMKKAIREEEIPRCEGCGGLAKPGIVFFGESLPNKFHSSIPLLQEADLLIVIGTSLTVYPFASLVDCVPEDCPRVLINLVEVGDFDKPDDLVFTGKCDEIVRALCQELGWEDELDETWAETAMGAEGVEVAGSSDKAAEEKIESELEQVRKDLENVLNVSEPRAGTEVPTGVEAIPAIVEDEEESCTRQVNDVDKEKDGGKRERSEGKL